MKRGRGRDSQVELNRKTQGTTEIRKPDNKPRVDNQEKTHKGHRINKEKQSVTLTHSFSSKPITLTEI